MKYLCKISIITHASAMAFSSVITYILVNRQKNIKQQYYNNSHLHSMAEIEKEEVSHLVAEAVNIRRQHLISFIFIIYIVYLHKDFAICRYVELLCYSSLLDRSNIKAFRGLINKVRSTGFQSLVFFFFSLYSTVY